MKNTQLKTRPMDDPYEIWGNSPDLPGWKWSVLKKWQADDNKQYARWFCMVTSPICPDGEMGDVYIDEIRMAKAQKICKGCHNNLDQDEVRNALSRYKHGYICSQCGTREAFHGDFIKNNKLHNGI